MGFTIATYSLYGLPPLSNIYVSIRGAFQIKKNQQIVYTNQYGDPSAGLDSEAKTQKDMCFSINTLPHPADLYTVIYDNIKQQLNTNGDLVFVDDL
jgi:hypothetical protein